MLVVIGGGANRAQPRDEIRRASQAASRRRRNWVLRSCVFTAELQREIHPVLGDLPTRFLDSAALGRSLIEDGIGVVHMSIDLSRAKMTQPREAAIEVHRWERDPSPRQVRLPTPRRAISSSDQKLPSKRMQSHRDAASISSSLIFLIAGTYNSDDASLCLTDVRHSASIDVIKRCFNVGWHLPWTNSASMLRPPSTCVVPSADSPSAPI